MRIYLDDIRTPKDSSWTVVRSYHDIIHLIQTSFDQIEVISFDHDLGEEKTGYDAAKFLIEFCMNNQKMPPLTFVHSANPVGRENIIGTINNFLEFNEVEPNCRWCYIEHT